MAVTCAQPTDVVKVRFQAHIRVIGTLPNITRNAIVNYNFPCHFVAAFGAGFCATVVASPVDVVKTRYMNSMPGQYKNALNCMLTMVVKEGPTAFYKGFMPSFLRLGSWNVVMFVSFEQLKRMMVLAQVAWESPF
ncbi:hypothetical protein JD844_033736 [Phrynosoma platyrhinos]|uniref:Mitochondrial brown fat uncoupling protein 1 n=1 Tax=Phrynosoma platyrhinos TaxID=52577 RepID=A0ABQ7T6X8_PHRPL|nr:hypothetical protein JD844_033736 [Phrynosoma platyrhinos]